MHTSALRMRSYRPLEREFSRHFSLANVLFTNSTSESSATPYDKTFMPRAVALLMRERKITFIESAISGLRVARLGRGKLNLSRLIVR